LRKNLGSRYGPKTPRTADPAGQIGELSGYPGADVVIETAGNSQDVVLPSAWAAPGGCVVFRELRTGVASSTRGDGECHVEYPDGAGPLVEAGMRTVCW